MTNEYDCQYSGDQIRKKHKIWHDGKLKLRDDGKIALYGEDGSKLSIKREISKWLNPENFNQEFQFCSRFVVIITSQDEKPSLALSMKPFKTPRTRIPRKPAKQRPAMRNNKVMQGTSPSASNKVRSRIRHVHAEPIRI